ncbi:MAG: tellurite resistance TerB family protein [Thiogranum sp.]
MMLNAVQKFFRSRIESDAGPDEHGLHLATAALLFEMLRADDHEHPTERHVLERALQEQFGLGKAETGELAALADREAADAVSLYQFTGLINEHFTPEQKVQVVEMLWQVAYADGRLDPYEEALVRKIADLIYVPHRDFIRSKHRVCDARK